MTEQQKQQEIKRLAAIINQLLVFYTAEKKPK